MFTKDGTISLREYKNFVRDFGEVSSKTVNKIYGTLKKEGAFGTPTNDPWLSEEIKRRCEELLGVA